MREALARSDLDFVLRDENPRAAPGGRGLPRAAPKLSPPSWRKRLPRRPARALAGAAFAALLVGVGVNAVLLQTGRHPAPLFHAVAHRLEGHPPTPSAPLPPPDPRPVKPIPAENLPAQAAAKPPAAAPPRLARSSSGDPIGMLIRREIPAPSEADRILAVQKALHKLGFPLKETGVFGVATRQALEKFQRERGLPVSGEITPRLLRLLAARSGLTIP